MLIAGHETSANTLVWSFYYLSRYPEVRARLEKEVDEVLGGRLPTTEDIDHLVYAGAVMDEVLRISPPSILVGRRCIEDCELGGYHIPKGTIVQPFIRAPHRNEKYWPQATEFRPERWFEPDQPKRPTHAYIPFGAGESKCAGVAFARSEVVLTLAIITQRWRVETKSKEFPKVNTLAGFYKPTGGLPCIVHRRE